MSAINQAAACLDIRLASYIRALTCAALLISLVACGGGDADEDEQAHSKDQLGQGAGVPTVTIQGQGAGLPTRKSGGQGAGVPG